MREESAPTPPPPEMPTAGPFAPGWLGRSVERVFTILAAAALFYFLYSQTAPRKRAPIPVEAASARPAATANARGTVLVQAPEGSAPEALRVSILQGGIYAAPAKDQLLRLLSPADLAQAPLPAGEYTAVFSYRQQVLTGVPVRIQPGKATVLPVPRTELARIEYETALARQNEDRNADVEHFQRVVALDPEHLDARLQLAAHALATGEPEEARRHLDVIDRVDSTNPHAARIRRLLGRMAVR